MHRLAIFANVITNVTNLPAFHVVAVRPQHMEGDAQEFGDDPISARLGTY